MDKGCLFSETTGRRFRRAVLVGGLTATGGDVLKLAALLGADVSDIQNERRRHKLLNNWTAFKSGPMPPKDWLTNTNEQTYTAKPVGGERLWR